MAHFYVTAQGSRGEVSQTGGMSSGVSTHARGWHVGARVELRHQDGKDMVYVFATRGSNTFGGDVLIAEFDASTIPADIRKRG